MMFCGSLKKCELKKCGLCDKPCKRPPCKPQCPCIKKIEEVREDLHTLEGKVDRNTQKIKNNYNLLNDAISDLSEKHAHDHNYIINYIDQKYIENDSLLQQEIARAKAAEKDIDDRLAKEIRDRIEDVNDEEDRAISAEQALDAKIDQEIADRIADVDAEETRAEAAEAALQAAISAKEARAISAETALDNKIIQEIADRKADVDAEEARAKTAEQDIDNRLAKEIADRIEDVDNEETRATTAETNITNNLNQEIQNRINGDNTLQQNINNLEQKHDQDIQDMNDHLDDILGIDAQGVGEIKAILSDDDTTTGLITELANKATKAALQAEIDRSTEKDNSHDTSIQDLCDNKANKSNMTAGTYTSVTVNQEGIVTAGSNPTTTYTKDDVDTIINGIIARLDVLESYWKLNTTTNRLETSYIIEPEGYR